MAADMTYLLTYPYHIVEFISAGRKPRNKSIDIVCSSWMSWDNKKKKMFVKYPPPPYSTESWEMYNDHLKLQFEALSEWKEYSIKIRGKATNMDEANEKLKLLNTEDTVLTMESDQNSNEVEKKQ
ncbi:hypothetical protein TKK_0005564 [Trichogramma kaykai]|uniref:Uncharacterized protein n=1 Tax=Trichogramma kaykai TaxID=54128 RepID=A0ABD2XHJ5_9HYME